MYGKDGEVDYSTINSILNESYNITSTSIGNAEIQSPTIKAATMYSPTIYGTNIVLTSSNSGTASSNVYNALHLSPTAMYLTSRHTGATNTKFYVDLGTETANQSVKMRLGAGADDNGAQALNIEKYTDEIRIGTYVNSNNGTLTDFAGMIIKPSTGAVTITGSLQAVAVFE